MEGRRIRMKDNTVYEEGEIGYADGVIWCFLKNVDLISAFQNFSDPEKAQKLVFEYGEMSDVYEDFTSISAIIQKEQGVNIMLRREAG